MHCGSWGSVTRVQLDVSRGSLAIGSRPVARTAVWALGAHQIRIQPIDLGRFGRGHIRMANRPQLIITRLHMMTVDHGAQRQILRQGAGCGDEDERRTGKCRDRCVLTGFTG